MIPKECKRLAEVDFPIAEVSRHAGREKSIRHGHPSTLHVWWARRPLASSRAVLLALLWPDPCDALCPPAFKEEARKRLREVPACNPGDTDEDLRHALLRFIADFANWDNSAVATYLDVSRALVKAAHASDGSDAHDPPLVVDPFAGGGSIPLEALRVGCDAFASDLNPVACLILKTMLEDIPRQGPTLAEELRHVGSEIKSKAEKDLAALFPKDSDGAMPIAYLWARTVRCEAPNCGGEIPLFRNRWLAKKKGLRRAFDVAIDRKRLSFQLRVIQPQRESDVGPGTVRRSRPKCLFCDTVLPQDRLQAQLRAQRGGGDVQLDTRGRRVGGATLLAVVTKKSGVRDFRPPTDQDYKSLAGAAQKILSLESENGGSLVPDEPLSRVPVTFGVINVWYYGVATWGDLFSSRQKLVLATLVSYVRRLPRTSPRDRVIANLAALTVSRFVDDYSNMMRWMDRGTPAATFARPALPMVWDYCEVQPFDDASWSLEGSFDWVTKAIGSLDLGHAGQAERAKAQQSPLADEAADIWFTDPPYYDNIPYSYLSDYFFVWLRRMVGVDASGFIEQALTDKSNEIVAYLGADGDPSWARKHFEEELASAFREGRRVLRSDGVASVVFAHQTTEGWEALLSALCGSGWAITASWPIATERKGRPRAHESAALNTSVHLICRPRLDAPASVGDWADVLRELPTRVSDWMTRMQREGVRGADLVFACIGPALEIFSRYTKVETAEGREVKLDEFLAKVWEVVGRSALAQVLGTASAGDNDGAGSAVEEDARLTALFLWTLQATNTEDSGGDGTAEEDDDADDDEDGGAGKTKGYTLVFDVVRRFAQPLGIELPKWEGRVIQTTKGVVRLLPIAERAKQLFGEEGASAVATRLEQATVLGTNPLQGMLFPEMEAAPKIRGGKGRGRRAAVDVSDEQLAATREATTLDRIHAAMLLQTSGRTNALRALLRAEQDRGPDFLRLANALSALYPKGSEEKRLLDAMLLAVPR
jgi:adenine-specific DNA methylase